MSQSVSDLILNLRALDILHKNLVNEEGEKFLKHIFQCQNPSQSQNWQALHKNVVKYIGAV